MPLDCDHLDAPDLLVIGAGTTGAVALAAALATKINAIGIDIRQPQESIPEGACAGVRAWGIFGDGTVACSADRGTQRLKPRSIIVATGATDLPLPLPGWEHAGVAGAFGGASGIGAGSPVAVVRGPHAGTAGRKPDLEHLDIVADIDLASVGSVSISGDETGLSLLVDGEAIAVERVLLDNGLQPENVLARMTGVPTTFAADAGGDVIQPGLIVALKSALLTVVGDASGIARDRGGAELTARLAGERLAEVILGGPIPSSIEHLPSWPTGGAPMLPSQTTDDTLLCPSEGVTVSMVRQAIALGATTVNDVKRRTRAAMATCQGRDCLWSIRALLAEADRAWTVPMTARPPAVGISVAELAGLATTES